MSVVSPGTSSNMSLTGDGGAGLSSSTDEVSKQQYVINSQQVLYQKEFDRMRERLFRILSKVPIQVETNRTNHGQEEAKNECQRGRVSDREPVTIKYYNQRSLAEILELHFSCSLIKHNYCHGIGSELTSYIVAPTQPAATIGWQTEENPLGYNAYHPNNHPQPTRGPPQPVPVNQYFPQARMFQQTPEVSVKQPWNSSVELTRSKTGDYNATSNDGCSLELVDGQRLHSSAPRQAGLTSSLAQENGYAKVCTPVTSGQQLLPSGYYSAQSQQQQITGECSALPPEVGCQHTIERLNNNQLGPFGGVTQHCQFMPAEELPATIDQHTTIPSHHEPPIYYQSNYRMPAVVQQHQQQHHHQQSEQWLQSPILALDYQQQQQPTVEPPKLIMIESDPQLKAMNSLSSEEYQQLTGYTATPGCCTFIYGASDQSLVSQIQLPANHHQPNPQPTSWAMQN